MDAGNSRSIYACRHTYSHCSFFSSLHCTRLSQSANRHSYFVNGFCSVKQTSIIHLLNFNPNVLIHPHLTLCGTGFPPFITLFISIITMMVTFTITFFIVYRHGFAWVPILIALFATVPVSLFASLQYPLLADVINSTYGSRFLFEPRKHMFDQ